MHARRRASSACDCSCPYVPARRQSRDRCPARSDSTSPATRRICVPGRVRMGDVLPVSGRGRRERRQGAGNSMRGTTSSRLRRSSSSTLRPLPVSVNAARRDRGRVRTQSSQRGRRASQTRRPCQISRCGKPAPVGARDELDEVALDLDRILLPRQPEPLREAAHVRVDDDALRVAELGRDDVRGLPRDARAAAAARRSSAGPRRRTPPGAPASHPDRLRLLAEEAGRVDVLLELLARHREVVLRPPVLLEQRRR